MKKSSLKQTHILRRLREIELFGTDKRLERRWTKCAELKGDYVENYKVFGPKKMFIRIVTDFSNDPHIMGHFIKVFFF